MDAKFWSDMLHPDISILEKIIRPVIVYFFLIVGLRLAGKRELAQLNLFDLLCLEPDSSEVDAIRDIVQRIVNAHIGKNGQIA